MIACLCEFVRRLLAIKGSGVDLMLACQTPPATLFAIASQCHCAIVPLCICQAPPRGQRKRLRSDVRMPDTTSKVVCHSVAVSLRDRVVDRLRAGSTPKECRSWLRADESKSQDQAERIVRKALALSGLRAGAVPFIFVCICVLRCDLRRLCAVRRDLTQV